MAKKPINAPTTEGSGGIAETKVKRLASEGVRIDTPGESLGEPIQSPPTPTPAGPRPQTVTLAESATYVVRGKTFRRGIPEIITEPKLLEAVLNSGRFVVDGHEVPNE